VPPRRLGQLGSIYLTHPSLPDYTSTREELVATANDLFEMIISGRIRADVTGEYALRDAPLAHADLESRKTMGAIVLIP
jgi:NADPH2:quinone reductase